MKLNKQYSPDTEEATATAEATTAEATATENVETAAAAETVDDNSDAAWEAAKPIGTKQAPDKEVTTAKEETPKTTDDGKAKEETTKEGDTTAATTEEGEELSIELGDEDIKLDTPSTGVAADTTWEDVGTTIGIKVKGDTVEAFKEAVNTHIAEIKASVKKESLALTHDPEMYSELYQELSPLDSLIAMSPEDKVAEAYMIQNPRATDQDLQDYLDDLRAEDKVIATSRAIDASLNKARTARESEIVNKYTDIRKAADEKDLTEIKTRNKSIADAIRGTEKMLGYKLPKTEVEKVAQYVESGDAVRDMLKNPSKAAEMFLLRSMNKAIIEANTKSVTAAQQRAIADKLMNAEQAKNSGGTNSKQEVSSRKEDDKPFSSWNSINEAGVKTKLEEW